MLENRLANIGLDIRVRGEQGTEIPPECDLDPGHFEPRSWCETTVLWKASALCHKPLYFEDVQLERYGHEWGPFLQPVVSGVHFFGTLPVLPYKMGLQTPNECVYALGYYRPGSCATVYAQPDPVHAASRTVRSRRLGRRRRGDSLIAPSPSGRGLGCDEPSRVG